MEFRGDIKAIRAVGWQLIALSVLAGTLHADGQFAASSYRDPADLVRKAVQKEIKASTDPSARFLFRGTKTTPKGSTTKLYVETQDATAGMIVAYDGKPLTEEQRQGERARLARFAKDPDELRKKRAQERENTDRTMRITRALPDAFLYEYAGEEKASPGIGHPGESMVKLSFRPNPNYDPPSRIEEVLRGMRGYVLVDAMHERLASIDATLSKDVGFGWGILGHLDRGGRFVVHQQFVENDFWEITSLSLKFTGKILLVKNLSIDSTEVFSGFRRVPSELTFAQGLELLAKEDAGAAEGSESNGRSSRK